MIRFRHRYTAEDITRMRSLVRQLLQVQRWGSLELPDSAEVERILHTYLINGTSRQELEREVHRVQAEVAPAVEEWRTALDAHSAELDRMLNEEK